MITKEQVIDCINNFIDLRHKVSIIRDYCIECNKDEMLTEIFLQGCRELNSKLQLLYNSGKLPNEPEDIFNQLFKFIIDKKIKEFNMILLFDSNHKLLNIY